MSIKFAHLAAALLVTASLAPTVFASGTYGGGSNYNKPAPQRQIDQVYETGKAIFFGRQAGVEKLSYCLKVEDEFKPVRRRSIKAYKNTSYDELAQNMVNCEQTDTKIASQLSRDDFLYVVYYLNKRHRLGLRS